MRCWKLSALMVSIMTLPLSVCAGELLDFNDDENKRRYKIFTAEHQSIEKGGNKTIKSIFKIDLNTGKVWRYRQGIDDDGKKFEEFFEVPEQ